MSLRWPKRTRQSSTTVHKSFFSCFSTRGCLLNCHAWDRYWEERKAKCEKPFRHEQRQRSIASFCQASQEWFPIAKMMESAAAGCRSCNVLLQIISKVFSEHLDDDLREYSVNTGFRLKRRISGSTERVEIIELFQLRGALPYLDFHQQLSNFVGLPVHLEKFRLSNFLHGKELSMSRLNRWLNECLTEHQDCEKYAYSATL